MKIGIITFHWGTNYGGVLQAYALQRFLIKTGKHEVKIINYAPKTFRDNFLLCFKSKSFRLIKNNLKEYVKEQKFVPFREKYLQTTKRYYSFSQLKINPPECDVYISGSDQVWAPDLIQNVGRPYFLDFGKTSIKRIAYAPSFGCNKYPDDKLGILQNELKRFDQISFRENSGFDILKNANITNGCLMPDPTMLLQKKDYSKLITNNLEYKEYSFFYILHNEQKLIHQILQKSNSLETLIISNTFKKYLSMDIQTWLSLIFNAKYFITNSFHGVVFSILFQKQFVVVPLEGKLSKMNDRITHLLNTFQLEEQLLSKTNSIESILKNDIDWSKTEIKLKNLRSIAYDYLKIHIN